MTWQWIRTAPRDGEPIILWFEREGWALIGEWQGQRRGWRHYWNHKRIREHPTHWKPIDPPTGEDAGSKGFVDGDSEGTIHHVEKFLADFPGDSVVEKAMNAQRVRKLLHNLVECYDLDRYSDFIQNVKDIVEEARGLLEGNRDHQQSDEGEPTIGSVGVHPEEQVAYAINYINEITNNEMGAGEEPVKFLCASHAALLIEVKELRAELNRADEEAGRSLDKDWESR